MQRISFARPRLYSSPRTWLILAMFAGLAFFFLDSLRAQNLDSVDGTKPPSASSAFPFGDADSGLAQGRADHASHQRNEVEGPGFNRADVSGDRTAYGSSSTGSAFLDRVLTDAYQLGMRSSRASGGGAGRALNLDSLFQLGSGLSRSLSKDLGKNSGVGTALGVLPKMDQFISSGVQIPLNSSMGKFQLSYKDSLGLGGNGMGAGIGSGSAQASFKSSGLKNDTMHFSATAIFGLPGERVGSSLLGPGMSGGAGPFGSMKDGMSSFGNAAGSGLGAGIGSGSVGSMMNGASGDQRGMGFARPDNGMGGMGSGSRHSGSGAGGSGPSVSLKLTF